MLSGFVYGTRTYCFESLGGKKEVLFPVKDSAWLLSVLQYLEDECRRHFLATNLEVLYQ